jgi:hypothetical protein
VTPAGVAPVGRIRWRKEGSMSDQYKGAVTSLEQVFLSREFEDARDRRVLLENRTEDADVQELAEISFSEQFGRPRHQSRSVTQAAEELPSELRLEDAVVAMLPTVPWESSRHRAIAAASGVAAAALVVAGLASGSAQQRRGDISAQGSSASVESTHAGSHPLVGGGSGSPSALSSGRAGASAAQAARSGPSGASPTFLTAAPVQAGRSGPPPAVTVVVPPGTTVTVVPSPAGSQSGPPGSGVGGSTGPPAPAPPGSGSPTAPVVVVGNTVTTVGTAVTTTANQVASSVTPVAPMTGALGGVGATVTGLGQNLSSTTA